jgi:thiol-disulfide isomerase/thioredoxin
MNQILEITNEQEYKDALDSNTGRMVVLFTAPAWCPPCQKFEPQYDRLPELTDATLLRVDVDKNAWTGGDIRSVPTIRLYEGSEYLRDLKATNADAFALSIQE